MSSVHSAFHTDSGAGSRYSRMPTDADGELPGGEQQDEQDDGRPVLAAEGDEFRHARRTMNLFIAFVPLISCLVSDRIPEVRLAKAHMPVKIKDHR